MFCERVLGAWMVLIGEFKLRVGELLADDVMELHATRQIFVGKLRLRTPEARLSAERRLDALFARVKSRRPEVSGTRPDVGDSVGSII